MQSFLYWNKIMLKDTKAPLCVLCALCICVCGSGSIRFSFNFFEARHSLCLFLILFFFFQGKSWNLVVSLNGDIYECLHFSHFYVKFFVIFFSFIHSVYIVTVSIQPDFIHYKCSSYLFKHFWHKSIVSLPSYHTHIEEVAWAYTS